jgi:pyruvate dehydrogenase E2 component (dihydrolipoamide acetyltransferase)
MDIKIPNLGDGIESAVVIAVLVKVGDTVSVDQTLLELETDKAVAPIPSPVAGTITSIALKEGDTVSMGSLFGVIDGGSETEAPKEPPSQPSVPTPVAASVPVQVPVNQVQPVSGVPKAISNENPVTSVSLQALAYRIGLDLRYIQGTGSGGRITEEDVRQHVAYLQSLMHQPAQVSGVQQPVKPTVSLPDFSKWGDVEVEKCSPLRKKIATNQAFYLQSFCVTANIFLLQHLPI